MKLLTFGDSNTLPQITEKDFKIASINQEITNIHDELQQIELKAIRPILDNEQEYIDMYNEQRHVLKDKKTELLNELEVLENES